MYINNIMTRLFKLLILINLLLSCNQVKVISQEEYNEYVEKIGLSLPDSLKTPEQILIKEKMTEIIFSNTEIRNNEMHLKVGRDYFVEQGLPGFCYDIAVFDQTNSNKLIKEAIKNTGIEIDIKEAFEEAKKNYLNK